MSLTELEPPEDEEALSTEILDWISDCRARIEAYWDRFAEQPHQQYVECDFEHVARSLQQIARDDLVDGQLFAEWGCGFGVVTGIASLLGFDAVGIEIEPFLADEARKLLSKRNLEAEIWTGNFLPQGARSFAEDDDPVVSLSHPDGAAYESRDLSLDDFAIVFAYPWPGEEHFLKIVFDRYARRSALLLLFRGPYQIELYRKQ